MKFNYAWSMPNFQTFKMNPINDFILKHELKGVILDPFANRKRDYGAITNDINPQSQTDFHLDALDFLKSFENESVDFLLFDPPYSLRQIKECYEGLGIPLNQRETQTFYSDLKNEISRIMKVGGVVISFGWSSVGIGKNRGFVKNEILLVCHGGHHNDTIALSETKVNE